MSIHSSIHRTPKSTPGSTVNPKDAGRIRIAHVIEMLGVGGAEKQLLGLLSRLDHQRFEHTVIYFVQCPDSLDQCFRDIGCTTVSIEKANVPTWRFFLNLRRTIQAHAPDIVHTWLYSANFWGRWAAVSCRIKHIVTSDRMEVERDSIPIKLYERLLARRTVRLANSQAVATSLHRKLGLPADRIEVIRNGVSLPPCNRERARRTIRRSLDLPEDHKLVIMLARQARLKNYPMLLRCAQRVCRRRSDVTFLAIGRQDHQAELDALHSSLALGNGFRFINSQSNVAEWLAAADVFCFTSNHEGCPNAILEAMMTGLPIVCTDFASATEVLTSDCGLLVPRDDDATMAEQIDRLFDDPILRQRLGTAARARAGTVFSWETVVHRMDDLYTSLIHDRS